MLNSQLKLSTQGSLVRNFYNKNSYFYFAHCNFVKNYRSYLWKSIILQRNETPLNSRILGGRVLHSSVELFSMIVLYFLFETYAIL